MASVDFDGTELCFIAACISERMEELQTEEVRLRILADALGVPHVSGADVVWPAYQRIVAKLRDAMEREDLETGLVPSRVLVS